MKFPQLRKDRLFGAHAERHRRRGQATAEAALEVIHRDRGEQWRRKRSFFDASGGRLICCRWRRRFDGTVVGFWQIIGIAALGGPCKEITVNHEQRFFTVILTNASVEFTVTKT